jgi:NADH:ubiquinone oxidoreductase subunit D
LRTSRQSFVKIRACHRSSRESCGYNGDAYLAQQGIPRFLIWPLVEACDEVPREHRQQEQVRERYSLQINFIGTWPKQELYVRVEAPKGELGIYLVGDESFPPEMENSSTYFY